MLMPVLSVLSAASPSVTEQPISAPGCVEVAGPITSPARIAMMPARRTSASLPASAKGS